MRYPHLWARLYGAPLLIWPDKAKVIEEVFRAHVLGTAAPQAMEDEPAETPEQRAARIQSERARTYSGIALMNKPEKPYALTASGIALVPVLGSLVQRGSWMDAMSGLTSYDRLASLVDAAVADPEVRALLLEIDSPGGEAGGIVEMAARVRDASMKKPTWSAANGMAYSAAYWIAAAAERVYAPITGGVGSIGAVAMHVDQSKRDKMMGYTYEFVYAGAKKVDLNSHQPLSDRGRARLQSEVDRFYELFTADVARDRGLTAEAVKATEAGLLTPPEAAAGGFIDGIATLRETVALLEQRLQQQPQPGMNGARMAASRKVHSQTTKKGTTMKLTPAATAIVAALGLSAESMEAAQIEALEAAAGKIAADAKAEGKSGAEKSAEAGRAEGAKAERERIAAVLGCDEAKDRAKLALHLALETDSAPEAAKKLLAAASKDAPGASGFAAAMAQIKNPKVGVDGEDAGAPQARATSVNEIYAARRQARAAGTAH
jgi:signal peptide peptidase SppA